MQKNTWFLLLNVALPYKFFRFTWTQSMNPDRKSRRVHAPAPIDVFIVFGVSIVPLYTDATLKL